MNCSRSIAYCDRMQQHAGIEARWTEGEPAWAYAKIALKWAERYYASGGNWR